MPWTIVHAQSVNRALFRPVLPSLSWFPLLAMVLIKTEWTKAPQHHCSAGLNQARPGRLSLWLSFSSNFDLAIDCTYRRRSPLSPCDPASGMAPNLDRLADIMVMAFRSRNGQSTLRCVTIATGFKALPSQCWQPFTAPSAAQFFSLQTYPRSNRRYPVESLIFSRVYTCFKPTPKCD